ncbi:potassium transporter Kup [Candidatus Cerribacteria bacterium 'Amazon FNV 2010 28 9']|uniref:Probable potassium transport system protein Kup n=1 Tax=Candidatus Cerribacteria bacterium 'Amazon FNV 2010 28 9' TaxID=2081795 RepID=A0A317JLI9_9BACT|nr:MAG: potassium transporter Kup [Candidatus Cerribacteria bacterium 'Amazon FNV 2010 28 9']
MSTRSNFHIVESEHVSPIGEAVAIDMHGHKKLTLTQQLLLAFGALGVVYGDIGTSPLYAIKEIFFGHAKLAVNPTTVIGVTSIVFWALTLIVTVKYVFLVLRADNDGEGGVFALYGLLENLKLPGIALLTALLILAAGLLFGDGVITPAISVISAVEGAQVAAPALGQFVIPITIVILTGLFFIQRKGTDQIGKLFGPIIAIWFISIAVLGGGYIVQFPQILVALNPLYAVSFLLHTPFHTTLLILGSVMLVVTGGEAMYADMGHFGRSAIRISWFGLTYIALLLSYFGQGAFLLSGKAIIAENIFYSMVPSMFLIPMIILATLATIIASQALITGAFSLASQAVGLGLFPLLKRINTHAAHAGQIYLPMVNWSLYVGCVLLVLMFKNSTNLAAAYGLAVSGVMLVTTLSMIVISQKFWKWNQWLSLSIFLPLAAIDFVFLSANSLKIFQGGYVPLLIGLAILFTMQTWRWGRKIVARTYAQIPSMTIKELVAIKKQQTQFLPRPIVIMTPEFVSKKTDKVPFLEEIFWERYGMMPKHLLFINVSMEDEPYCYEGRYEVTKFYEDEQKGSIISVLVRFGFMEDPNVEDVLEGVAAHEHINIDQDPEHWQVHIAQERIFLINTKGFLYRMRFYFFRLLLRNATTFDHYLKLGKRVRLSIESIPVRFEEKK